MLNRQGFTLIEILVVLIIIAIWAVMAFPNFTNPTEQARSQTAQNNLLAIYSAQKNYFNNNGGTYYYSSNPAAPPSTTDDTSGINTALSLNIQNDGTYAYNCGTDPSGFSCLASRTSSSPAPIAITVTNMPVQLNPNNPNLNPTCSVNPPGLSNWCPG